MALDLPGEDDRLRSLYAYQVLDTPEEQAFDDLARAAAKVCEAPMAAVSLVDAARQWFKAEVGLGVRETPREVSFCAHAMHDDALFIVPDTHSDLRFRDNKLVTGEPGLRFYAGASIRAQDGAPLGALCVLDTRPRPQGLSAVQAQMLRVLADQVEPHLRLRLAVREREAHVERHQAAAQASLTREARLLSVLESAELGWWDWDVAADRMIASQDLARAFGLDGASAPLGAPLASLCASIHPQDRASVRDAMAQAMKTGEPFREEYRLLGPDGTRWVSSRGRCLRNDRGEPSRFAGVVVDITARMETEARLREADIGRELALDAARLGRFDHDVVAGTRFYDARALQMLTVTAEEAQDSATLFSRIHPEDRQRVMDAQTAARNPERRGPYREVYRVCDPALGETRWISGVGRTQFDNGVCTRFMGVLEDVTEAKQAETHRLLLIHELNHRVKNTLALVQAVVDASLRNASDPAAARADIMGRIQALSRAHDILTAQSWSAASTSEVVEGVVASLSLPRERLRIAGAPVQLGPKPALQLTLALHELATNTLKYGALTNGIGVVEMSWGVHPEVAGQVFRFEWIERGGPAVTAPTRRGFGSRLIERLTATEFGGEVELSYAPDGVVWRLCAPYAGLAERGRGESHALTGRDRSLSVG